MRDNLISRLKDHHATADTSNFKILDFVSAFGSPLEALAYSYLFWPDFIEFEEMIFHEGVIEDEDDRSRIRAALPGRTAEEVEKSFNQFLIPDGLFSSGLSTTSDVENTFLAERLAEAWRARLAVLFPNKKCVVEVELEEENNEGPTIIVYQG
jgi:hypothetical protein